ncbi:MAG TPA: GNAT family N-acetyltransferase [Thermoanaerobaculia bacterium]|jgi:GNAT superfamily N-acetyltransferase
MIRLASPADLPALRELFARANDAPYDLSVVTEEKCFGEGIAGQPVTRVIEQQGRLIAASVRCGKWLRLLIVDRDERRKGHGTALLDDVSVIAAEPGNYFVPGVPLNDEGAKAFFRARGFVEGVMTWNLDVELEEAYAADVRRPTHEEAPRVLEFVEREFGRVWRFEAAKAFERELPPAFIAEEAGAVTGFAVHDVNNRGLGWFGPTGVAKQMRGRGVGGRLLLASLGDLRRLGYSRAIIPWTDALEFYAKASGAKPAHQFVAFARTRP